MKRHVLLTSILLISLFTSIAGAELEDRGNGLIYDDILDITWLQNANYLQGTLTWEDAMSWADSLVFQGYGDWRLPASDTSCTGYNCTTSEMGHLYYNYDITYDTPVMFTDVRTYMYWSAAENAADLSKSWRFHFGTGYQSTSSKAYTRYAWAVRDGDSAPPLVPEPISLVLFISGGISLAVRRFLNK